MALIRLLTAQETAQLGQGILVLRTARPLLGLNDVVKARHAYDDSVGETRLAPTGEGVVVLACTTSIRNVEEHVEQTGVRDPRGHSQTVEHLSIQLHRELASLIVGHSLYAKPCAEVTHGSREAIKVLTTRPWEAVEVIREPRRPVRLSADTTYDKEVDLVAAQGLKDPSRVEWWAVSDHPRSPSDVDEPGLDSLR
jgi:hypothetical protein